MYNKRNGCKREHRGNGYGNGYRNGNGCGKRGYEHGEHERENGEYENHGRESRSLPREKVNDSFWLGMKSYKGYGLK